VAVVGSHCHAEGADEVAGLSTLLVPRAVGALTTQPFSLSSDGQLLAAVEGNRPVLLRRVDGRKVSEFAGHTGTITGLAFAPDSKQIATCSYDHTVRLWNTATGEQLHLLASAGQDFEYVACSPDSRWIVALNDDRHLWIWEARNKEANRQPTGTPSYQNRLCFSPDSKILASLGGGSLIIWDTDKWTQRFKVSADETGLVFGPRGEVLATHGSRVGIKLRSLSDGSVQRELKGHDGTIIHVAFSQTGQYLVSCAAEDKEALVWDVAFEKVLLRLLHPQKVSWAAFVPDGHELLTFSDKLYSWDLRGLDDPEKRTAFLLFNDGEKDHYSAYIHRYLASNASADRVVAFAGDKTGQAITRIASRRGLTIEAIDVSVAGQNVRGAISVKTNAGTLSLEPAKLRSIDVLQVNDKTISLMLTLLDGKQQPASLELGDVVGRSAWGEFAWSLAEIKRMSFDFPEGDRKAREGSDATSGPCPAEVRDSENGRIVAADLKIASSGDGHNLPVYIDAALFKMPFSSLRKVVVLAAPRRGVLVRVTLANSQELTGFISASQVSGISGTLPFGSFDLELSKLKAITFP
jgi:WD40 repeat protein